MPPRPLDVVEGRPERGLVEIVGFQRSKKADLETLDGADPEPGKQKVPGLEAMVDAGTVEASSAGLSALCSALPSPTSLPMTRA
jgi:hypothetical protein